MTTYDAGWRQMVTEAKRPLAKRPPSDYELAGWVHGYDVTGQDWHCIGEIGDRTWKLRKGHRGMHYAVEVINKIEQWGPIDFQIGMTPAEIWTALEAAR